MCVAMILAICAALFLFLKRVVYPDNSFDTLNYHFFLGQEGFNNFPYQFKSNEFFPLGMHGFIPFFDMIGCFFYSFFGYRLGTLPSILSIIGYMIIGYLIIKKITVDYTKKNSISFLMVALLIFPVFITQEGIFQTATYFTDNLYAFVSMLFLYLSLKFTDEKRNKMIIYYILGLGFLAGLLATKLTNIIYVIPFSLFLMYEIYEKNKNGKFRINAKMIWLTTIYILIILLINFQIFFNFFRTGNPIFPYYNGIFKSVYYPKTSWPFNCGPKTLSQKIFYPFYAIKNPTMLGEVKEMFPDIKLFIVFFFTLLSFFFLLIKKRRFSKLEWALLFIYFSSFFLWQIEFGYSRYGIFLEILGGIISISLILKIFSEKKGRLLSGVFSFLYIAYMLYQSINIFLFNYQYDISWRPTPSIDEWGKMIMSPEFFYKYTIVNKKIKKEMNNADIVIQCVNPSSGYFSTIKELKDKPMLNFDRGSNGDLTTNENYKSKRDLLAINSIGSKTLNFAIVFDGNKSPYNKDYEKCLSALKYNGIVPDKQFTIDNFIGNKNNLLTLLIGKYTPK